VNSSPGDRAKTFIMLGRAWKNAQRRNNASVRVTHLCMCRPIHDDLPAALRLHTSTHGDFTLTFSSHYENHFYAMEAPIVTW